MIPLNRGDRSHLSASGINAAPLSPTLQQEVTFINGLSPDGTINNISYWAESGVTAFKFGASTAGTSATVTYSFDPTSNFTAQEKATILVAFANWSAVANVKFVESDETPSGISASNLLLHRGSDGGAYTSATTTLGSGSTLGHVTGQTLISIDTSVAGFELSGSFSKYGGYGLDAIIHEVGHFLGLGHGGAYNGDVDPSTQQFSAYDNRQWSAMSYIYYASTDAKYYARYTAPGTYWGTTVDGIDRQAPHSVQMLDILAIQQLYGAAVTTPFSGGQVYGFHSNISGPLHDTYDFTVNDQPVLTLFNEGNGNTLDLTGYSVGERVDLHAGTFSDVGGLYNNVAIAFGTAIDTAITGAGFDVIVANDHGDIIKAGGGTDSLTGGLGQDSLLGQAGADTIVGGLGADTIDGGADLDTVDYSGSSTAVVVNLATGVGSGGDAAGDKLISIEFVVGSNFSDRLTGSTGVNTILGGIGNDQIDGGAGNDTLFGEDGKDVLTGGAGRDVMTGGIGADRFVFTARTETSSGSNRDIITDFNHSESDRIDLSAIDANNKTTTNDAFTFINGNAFGNHAGELHYIYSGDAITIIEGDIDGNGTADFQIQLTGHLTIVSGDFML